MDVRVGLNVATCVCDVYPDKCLFAILCRFWLWCSCTLKMEVSEADTVLPSVGWCRKW